MSTFYNTHWSQHKCRAAHFRRAKRICKIRHAYYSKLNCAAVENPLLHKRQLFMEWIDRDIYLASVTEREYTTNQYKSQWNEAKMLRSCFLFYC